MTRAEEALVVMDDTRVDSKDCASGRVVFEHTTNIEGESGFLII